MLDINELLKILVVFIVITDHTARLSYKILANAAVRDARHLVVNVYQLLLIFKSLAFCSIVID